MRRTGKPTRAESRGGRKKMELSANLETLQLDLFFEQRRVACRSSKGVLLKLAIYSSLSQNKVYIDCRMEYLQVGKRRECGNVTSTSQQVRCLAFDQ